MNPTSRTPSLRSGLARGARTARTAGTAVAVAFVGTAALTPGQAQASGVATGPTYAAESSAAPAQVASSPTALPRATSIVVRYRVEGNRLIAL